MYNVVCIKHGTKYSAEYVNNLFKGVQKHLSLPHRFVCLTDDPKDIDCETLPLNNSLKGWWNKLSLFAPEVGDLAGTVLYIDLDMIIVGSLDEYLTLPGSFYVMRDMTFKNDFSSAIMKFDIGKEVDIWEEFVQHQDKVVSMNVGDQNWINLIRNPEQKHVGRKTTELRKRFDYSPANQTIEFFPDEWQQDVHYSLRYKNAGIKSETKIVVFYGSNGRDMPANPKWSSIWGT